MEPIMEEKQCKNCKYYLAHYIKYNAQLRQIGGQCFNPQVKAANPESACELWESNQAEKEQREQSIYSAIVDMRNKLEEIAMILKDDNAL